MDVYVNECSIHEQYHDQAAFDIALQKFYQMLDLLNQQKLEFRTYQKEGWINVYQAVYTKPFIANLNAVRRKDLRVAFFRILKDGLNAQDWQQVRVHSSDDVYMCNEEFVTDTSMAEAAERIAQATEEMCVLINFSESKFAGSSFVEVIKNEQDTVSIDCVEQYVELRKWLESNFHLSKYTYDYQSNICPTDAQTVLITEGRFMRTSQRYDGRVIYREIATNYYWYVDNFHVGYAAHLEVFDATGVHLGEASLDGIINGTKKDFAKKLLI